MRAERFVSAEPAPSVMGSGTLILAAIGCFAVGFVALMAIPRLWPRYVPTPVAAETVPALRPTDVVVPASIASAAPLAAAPNVVQQLHAESAPTPQKITAHGGLAALNECKAAINSGGAYAKVGADQLAAMFGTRGRPLTPAQLDAACRKLTE